MRPDPGSIDLPPWEVVPLGRWEPPHPVAAALLCGRLPWPQPTTHPTLPRSPGLAEALAAHNRRWGNPVEEELHSWLAGAAVVVAGQQPGVWGGPLLSLVKACAVAAEVARLRASGTPAVGFFWLETRDDDLPEMGWGRVVVGGELVEVKERWHRGQACALAAPLSAEPAAVLALPGERVPPEGRKALPFLREAFAPGVTLGEACSRLLGRLLSGLGVVLVDAGLPALARAAAPAALALLSRLEEATAALEARAGELAASALPPPLHLRREMLPFFLLEGGRRRRIGVAAREHLAEALVHQPESVAPNVWVRPLLQDAALGTTVALLGSSELAYQWQAQDLWDLAGVPRPLFKLRPHVTVVGPGERRLVAKLAIEPQDLLSASLPQRIGRRSSLEHALTRMEAKVLADFARFASQVREQLPALAGDLEATQERLSGSLGWLSQRLAARLEESRGVERQRFDRLRRALRPKGRAQERALSVAAPLLSLGLGFPSLLVEALGKAPLDPGEMLLLYWREGGLW